MMRDRTGRLAGMVTSAVRLLPAHVGHLVWNFSSGALSAVLAVVCAPLLLHRYTEDGFGLIGLWLSLQVVVGLFDLGLSTTLTRELSRPAADVQVTERRGDTLRTFEVVTWGVSLLILLVAIAGRSALATTYARSSHLSQDEIGRILGLIGLTLCLQFPTLLYSSGLVGLGRHRTYSLSQMQMNVARWGGGVLIATLGASLLQFFLLQAVISLLMTAALRLAVTAEVDPTARATFDRGILRYHQGFALGTSAAGICAVLIANLDRAVITSFLTLGDLGIYSIASVVGGGIQMMVLPFYRVYFPRFAGLAGSDRPERLVEEYLSGSMWASSLIIPVVTVIFLMAPDLVRVWTGSPNPLIARLMQLLCLGVGAASLGWLAGALQQAHGDTSLRLSMLIGAILFGVPLSVVGIERFGVLAATFIWLVHGIISLLIEPAFLHRRLLPGTLGRWYWIAVIRPVGLSVAAVAAMLQVWPGGDLPLAFIGKFALICLITTGTVVLTGPLRPLLRG